MKLGLDLELGEAFLKGLEEQYSETREGIHVSDLIYCLREAYWRKVDPQTPSERQLGFYLDGARRHGALQALIDSPAEVGVEKWGVKGRIDLFWRGLPVEFKTTRAREGVPDHYLRQLAYYCCLLGVRKGYLVIHRLVGDPPFEFYSVEWTEEEMRGIEKELRERADLLREALEKGDPSMLPKGEPWKCRWCPYRQRCEEMDGGEA